LLWFFHKAMHTTSLFIHHNHTIFGWLIHLPNKKIMLHSFACCTYSILIMWLTTTEFISYQMQIWGFQISTPTFKKLKIKKNCACHDRFPELPWNASYMSLTLK
jgi:hypothetical protein